MADQTISVPQGSRFLLRWTFDMHCKVTNTFQCIDGSTVSHVGPAGKKPQKQDVEIKISVTRDGQPDGFRTSVPEPKTEPDWAMLGGSRSFTSTFEARKEGVFLFTVEAPDGNTKTKEVTVTPGPVLNDKRLYMVDIITRWMPTSVLYPRPPANAGPEELSRACWTESRIPDLMELSGWTPKEVAKWKAVKDAGGLVTTSCGDVLDHVLRLWGINFDDDPGVGRSDCRTKYSRAFGIRDDGTVTDSKGNKYIKKGTPPLGAVTHGYYQYADEAYKQTPPLEPKPGDVLVLNYPPNHPTMAGYQAHVEIFVSANEELWTCAGGGGGSLDNGEQSAEQGSSEVTYTKPDKDHPKGRPLLISPTDGQQKIVDGWVILDKIPNPLYNPDGSAK